ncbi:hypothetical protein [uncultured Winogradskyella sp.]|uniref:hypothetical protein n=1 Tax=uncultured Winogradskyella sp. TaxID=395353 RepID=UPI00262329E2|nr:hypothetical protein [uncultured Winogradskyella sp.]
MSSAPINENSANTTNSSELAFFEMESIPLEGQVCRTVTTSCGGDNSSTNRACVTYEGTDARAGANFLAQTKARAAGVAACQAMASTTTATAIIKD